ncbi:MAG: 23S rRNA (guanosine(2251)-2'-O)-methyltransferase RlmB [Bdellovibrionales bacterium]|nr:23S rRNA (guanosine(2251)-2'-O)-methyltransferase RlmB [Bdellovibrionales bacterium]
MAKNKKKPLRRTSKSLQKHHRWVVGLHACREVLNVRPQDIVKAMVKKNSEGEVFLRQLDSLAVDIRWVNDQELQKLARSHQGIALEVNSAPEIDWQTIYAQDSCCLLLLDGIVDPHNLGAIMRTAWLMDCKAVVTTQNRSVGLTPSVAKVASGATEHIPLVVEAQLTHVIKDLKSQGFWILGLAHSEKNHLWQQDLAGKVAWVIGSEEKGLRKPVAQECDQLISIPQAVSTASYNASVAAAIAMAETQRQHQLGSAK